MGGHVYDGMYQKECMLGPGYTPHTPFITHPIHIHPLSPGNGSPSTHQSDVLEQHLQHIAALEQEVQRLRRLQRISGSIMNTTMRAHGGPGTPVRGPPGSPSEDVAVTPLAMAANDMMEDGEDFAAEEQAYRCVSVWEDVGGWAGRDGMMGWKGLGW